MLNWFKNLFRKVAKPTSVQMQECEAFDDEVVVPTLTIEIFPDNVINVVVSWPDSLSYDEIQPLAQQLAVLTVMTNTGQLLEQFKQAISINGRMINDEHVASQTLSFIDNYYHSRHYAETTPVVPPTQVLQRPGDFCDHDHG